MRNENGPSIDAAVMTRRVLLTRCAAAGAAALGPTGGPGQPASRSAAAQADDARLQGLLALSLSLCGGGRFDSARAATLLGLLDADASLSAGLGELLEASTAGTPVASPASPSADAQAARRAILLYWYTGYFDDQPIADRSQAAYQLTAWQAMYTPPFAVCKAFGGWTDPPSATPLVPR